MLSSCKVRRLPMASADSRDSVRVETVIRTEYIRDTVEIPVGRMMQIAEAAIPVQHHVRVSWIYDSRLHITVHGQNLHMRRYIFHYRPSIQYKKAGHPFGYSAPLSTQNLVTLLLLPL